MESILIEGFKKKKFHLKEEENMNLNNVEPRIVDHE